MTKKRGVAFGVSPMVARWIKADNPPRKTSGLMRQDRPELARSMLSGPLQESRATLTSCRNFMESCRLQLSLAEAGDYRAAAECLHMTCDTAPDLGQPITA